MPMVKLAEAVAIGAAFRFSSFLVTTICPDPGEGVAVGVGVFVGVAVRVGVADFIVVAVAVGVGVCDVTALSKLSARLFPLSAI